jgi:hypothetical protein
VPNDAKAKEAIDRMALAFLSAPAAGRARILEIFSEEFVAEAARRGLSEEQSRELARKLAQTLAERVLEVVASGGGATDAVN